MAAEIESCGTRYKVWSPPIFRKLGQEADGEQGQASRELSTGSQMQKPALRRESLPSLRARFPPLCSAKLSKTKASAHVQSTAERDVGVDPKPARTLKFFWDCTATDMSGHRTPD